MRNNVMRQSWTLGAAAVALVAAAPAQESEPTLPPVELPTDDLVTAPAAATTPAAARPVPPLTAEERRRLVAAGLRGHLLFELARAGQLSTQDMLARLPDPSAAGIAGWLAVPDGDGMVAIYYADTADGPVAVYRGRIAGGRIATSDVFVGADRPALDPAQRRMAAARAAVATLDRQPCGGDFNVIVIPPESASAPVEVYKLSPQTQRGRYPLGGHFLVTVAADGSIASTRAFTNRCLDLEPAIDLAGTQPRPIAVTHLLDPLPTEIHVFLSLWMNRPLLVATGNPDRLWTISRGRIGIVGGTPQVPPPGPGR